uniref:Uncharacterized protein n=1 Tax=Anopheles quadriannulatus TaxID=34691 RepID=A0A182XRB3_ANOQN
MYYYRVSCVFLILSHGLMSFLQLS